MCGPTHRKKDQRSTLKQGYELHIRLEIKAGAYEGVRHITSFWCDRLSWRMELWTMCSVADA
jgi:hypothetical protein